jgi:HSP20 family protein
MKGSIMANVSVYDPFGPAFNRLFSVMGRPHFEDKNALEVKIDVAEDENNYTVRADIPGVTREDIKVDVDGNVVSISAEVKKNKEEKKGEAVVYAERYEGKVFRSFTLDRDVDETKAVAKYTDGVLELVLPKRATGAKRRLSVS